MLVFEERGKPEYPEENLSEQNREPITNSTHVWRRVRKSNPGHIGGRRALTLLPWYIACFNKFQCFNSQRVLYAYRREDRDGDGEPDPQPIPGSFSGKVPQIVELVTVSSNEVGVLLMSKCMIVLEYNCLGIQKSIRLCTKMHMRTFKREFGVTEYRIIAKLNKTENTAIS